MIAKFPKEVCRPCNKSIGIGQPIVECENCSIVIHTKCHKNGGFSICNNLWLCHYCSENIIPRYNPFSYLQNSDTEKFYDDHSGGVDSTLQSISIILDMCKAYTTQDFEKNLYKSLEAEVEL